MKLSTMSWLLATMIFPLSFVRGGATEVATSASLLRTTKQQAATTPRELFSWPGWLRFGSSPAPTPVGLPYYYYKQPEPTIAPTIEETFEPTIAPSDFPSAVPSLAPSAAPTTQLQNTLSWFSSYLPLSLRWGLAIPFLSISCIAWACRGGRRVQTCCSSVPEEIVVTKKNKKSRDDVELVNAATWEREEPWDESHPVKIVALQAPSAEDSVVSEQISTEYIVMK